MTLYHVGIDGGGTSCRARIRDEHNTLVGEAKSGSANIMLGAEIAMEIGRASCRERVCQYV